MKIYVSILAADPLGYGKVIEQAEKAGVDGLHMDVLDGHFAPDIMFGPKMCDTFAKATTMPIGAHLMVTNTEEIIEEYCKTRYNKLTIHIETTKDVDGVIKKIKDSGIRVALAVDMYTDVSLIKPYIDKIDGALVMSVKAGAGGQSFHPEAIDKIKTIRQMAKGRNDFGIIVDGGIKPGNIKEVQAAGADAAVMGTALTAAENMTEAMKDIRKILGE